MCPETQAPWPRPASPATLPPISAHIGARSPSCSCSCSCSSSRSSSSSSGSLKRAYAQPAQLRSSDWNTPGNLGSSTRDLRSKRSRIRRLEQDGSMGRIAARHQHDPWPQKTDSKDLLITKGKRKRTTQTQTRSTSATAANPLLPSPQGSPCVEGASERYDVANQAPTQDFVEFDTTKSIVFGYDEVPQI